MKQTTLYVLSFIFVLLVSACQAPKEESAPLDMDAIRVEIQAMEDAYAASANAKNLEGQTAYYSDDAQGMSPDKPTLDGKAAILADIQAEMDKNSDEESTIRFEVVDLYADGDLLVEAGRSITTKADGTESFGKYVSIFEKRDGKYVCVRDIYNSDQKESSDDDDDEDDDDDDDDSESDS